MDFWNKIKTIAGFGKVDSWLLAKDKLPDKLFMSHPKLGRLIQKAFTIKDGKNKYTFYEFKEIHDMPSYRWTALNEAIDDHNRRVTNEDLKEYTQECLSQINKNTPENLANVVTILKALKMQSELVVDSNLVLRLVSVAFFTKDEDLLTYDYDYGNWKIELFEKHGLSAFFLLEPIKNWLPLTDILPSDIEVILSQNQVMKQYWKELNKLGITAHEPSGKPVKVKDSI